MDNREDVGQYYPGGSVVPAKPEPAAHPIESVNGKAGAVVLTAADVGALPDTTEIPDAEKVSAWGFLRKAWSDLVAAFADKVHRHTIGQVDGLQSELSTLDLKATGASDLAASAQGTADSAAQQVSGAYAAANAAELKAGNAFTTAMVADSKASTAKLTAEKASGDVKELEERIDGVDDAITAVNNLATTANVKADEAKSAAASAFTEAANANSTAELALSAANGAESVANAAQSTANEAKSSADGAIADIAALPTVAHTGSYDDLTDKPEIATVATTGDYNDLYNLPTIPTEAWEVNALPSGTTAADIGGLAAGGTAYDSDRLGGYEAYNYYFNGSSADLNCGGVNASGGVSASGDVTSNGGMHNLADKLDTWATAADSYRLGGMDASDYALRKSGNDFECESIYTGSGGIMSSGEIESNDGAHKLSMKLNADDAPYKLNTAGTILNRAVNKVTLPTSGTVSLTPPAAIPGKVRDFVVKLVAGAALPTLDWSAFGTPSTAKGETWDALKTIEANGKYLYRFFDDGDGLYAAREEMA